MLPIAKARAVKFGPPADRPPTTAGAAAPTTPSAMPTTPLSTAPAPASSVPASTTPTTAGPVDPNRRICRITTGAGVYYLNVTSAAAHNFRACDGAAPYAGTLDELLALPNMDRRCILGDDYTAREQAIVGVYSDTAKPNLDAALAFCHANGGTDFQ